MMLKVTAAAEASVVAEEARARFLQGDTTISLDDVVRADRRAASAVAALGIRERPQSGSTFSDIFKAPLP